MHHRFSTTEQMVPFHVHCAQQPVHSAAVCPTLTTIPSLHGRRHVGWVNSETPWETAFLEPWHYCFIIFPSSRKQMGQPEHDFYLLFLSKVPKGFLLLPRDRPQIYSAGEKQATSADLMLKALVGLNVLFLCYLYFFFNCQCLFFACFPLLFHIFLIIWKIYL